MKSTHWALLGSLVCVVSLAQSAQAQYAPGTYPPAISPYLNLFRPGGSITSNYFNLVRPEVQTRNALSQLQLQQQQLAARIATPIEAEDTGVETGVAAGFMTHASYFGGGGGHQVGFQTVNITTRAYSPLSAITPAQPIVPGGMRYGLPR